MAYDNLDITNDLQTYFESKEEFIEFSNKILEKFDNLEKLEYKNINLNMDARTYSEYGEQYPYLSIYFEYEREETQEEIDLEIKKLEEEKINKQITDELIGKLSSNSIGSIIFNNDLRQLYLDGKIKI